jgi:methylaspartate mutase epsilon subunit
MQTHVISHQFMGVFPKDRSQADALIFMGGLVARLGNATKVITKTCQEAIGRPDASANIAALRLTRAAIENRYSYPAPGEEQLLEEERQILSEVREIVDPVLEGGNLPASILHGFDCGRLDIPFPANADAKGEIVPVRDKTGAIRFANTGRLPFSPAVKKAACKAEQDTKEHQRLSASLRESIFYFSEDILCGRHL